MRPPLSRDFHVTCANVRRKARSLYIYIFLPVAIDWSTVELLVTTEQLHSIGIF